MKYAKPVVKATFLSRPNRFLAHVLLEGREEVVHVKNTGRCRELLVPGTTVYLLDSQNPLRKTRYDLIAVEKGSLLVNMDSQIPNDVMEEWLERGELFSRNAVIRRETFYGDSRFDFYVEDGERKAFLEVKGCTLENEGLASFPDAPTERGVKHIRELEKALDEGYEAYVAIVLQMEGMKEFRPNWKTHPEFGEELERAVKKGVKVLVLGCSVTPDSLSVSYKAPLSFSDSANSFSMTPPFLNWR